ncbi:hypothetical protein [Xenorhabdus bovienii]|uniref:Uncharacterized protein n=1 Tax=Xenorhabdus bovienii str. feltiae Moldova TaxID=1398200 RepID=A0A077NLV6_XENBV|nr:hypothetical protein [Xenorhabdus bovienii]CDG99554.1 conserved hypothetical protein [Xenorhabdus bovienii str. feltiae Moldova]
MALPQYRISEKLSIILESIDKNEKLDIFTFKQAIKDADVVQEEPIKLMLKALAYGAYQDNSSALKYFERALKYQNAQVVKNYITYLSRTFQFELYLKESIRLANQYNDKYITFLGRNVSYNFSDIKNASLLADKLVKLYSNVDYEEFPILDFSQNINELEVFMSASAISESDAKWIISKAYEIAANHKIMCVSTEFYTSPDKRETAIIFYVKSDDNDVISDMDIEIACNLSIREDLSQMDITAWFKSSDGLKRSGDMLL